ncbi:MAG: hypothetical protein Q7J10_09305 [Methanosarcinaceae archaeon]|nr:hypothetical protein [Methanosarcinaceae archaeon]
MKIHEDFIGLPVEAPVELTDTESRIIRLLEKNELSISEISVCLNQKPKSGILKKSLKILLNHGIICLTIPDKPNSPKQKYRITEKGLNLLKFKN